jgi:sulfatase modifying factor 1
LLDFDFDSTRGCDEECRDCCESDEVPGGTFDRGWDRSNDPSQDGVSVRGFTAEGVAPATVSSFRIDRYEVTRARFARFVDSYDLWRSRGLPVVGVGDHPSAEWRDTWDAYLPEDAASLEGRVRACGAQSAWSLGDATLPMNCISWYISLAFCIWDDARLPTEAEWHYAATGGNEQRAFPWSVPPNARVIDETYAVIAAEMIQPVGSVASRDAARWGTHDLAGNVREWTLDAAPADPVSYTGACYDTPCIDCTCNVLTAEATRVRRGGDFSSDTAHARPAWRSDLAREESDLVTGIRCVRNL